VLVGRDWGRLRAARERIHAAVPDADLALERADFAALGEVRDLAERLIAAPPPEPSMMVALLLYAYARETTRDQAAT
jgi:hypothetical protein